MTTAQLRPDGVYSNSWPVLPGGYDAATALSDNNDFSYIKGQFALYSLRLAFNSVAMPAGSVVRTITPIVRAAVDDPTSAAYFDYQVLINNANTIPTNLLSPNFRSQLGDTPPDVLYLTGISGNRSQSDIDNLGLSIGSGIVTGQTHALLTEMYINVLFVPPPTTVATGPTGTLTVNNPTITWVHQPGADAPGGQDIYRVVVYDASNNAVAYDTGNVASGASSVVVGPLALQKTYVAYAYTMQTTDGIQQWASSSTPTTFTLDVTGPTVTINAPANNAVVGTTSPTVSWTHHPGTGAQTGQTYYRLRAFLSTDLVNPVIDTGNVASSASSAVIGPLDATKSWRVVVNTAQTTYGNQQWSPDVATNFTINVTPATIASVTATPDNSTGSIPITIAATTLSWVRLDGSATSYITGPDIAALAGAQALTIEIDCSLDDWTPAVAMQLAGQYATAPNNSWRFYINTTGTGIAQASADGTTVDSFTSAALALTDGTRHVVGGVWTAVSGANSSFQFKVDGANKGAAVTNPSRAAGLSNSTYPIRIGADNAGNLRTTGNVYAVRIYAGATLVASPDFTKMVAGQTSVTDAQGNVWTIGGTVVQAAPSPMWQTIDVQATYDGGTTWLAVRGATALTVNGNTAHVTDYEAPNDTPVQYRARAARLSSGVLITSNWVTSAVVSWQLTGDAVWVKDPAHPENNMRVCLSALPQPLYDRTQGVFRPVGAHFPVVVSDVLQAPTTPVSVITSTLAEAQALQRVLSAPVVLVQAPNAPWGWDAAWVAPGAVQQARTMATSRMATRIWTVALTEVARPADEAAQ